MRQALAVIAALLAWVRPDDAGADARFACGGGIEAQTWALWDGRIRAMLDEQLQDRLRRQEDAYALYDFQSYAHNAMAMARRCGRAGRLAELAGVARNAYAALEPDGFFSTRRRWVCRGGAICNQKNRLMGNEVMLNSAQFLGFASALANALALSTTLPGEDEREFVRETVQIATEHLLRWSTDAAIERLERLARAKPEDVKSASSDLFFTDKELWLITIHAELAGVLQSPRGRGVAQAARNQDDTARLRRHARALMRLFLARISIEHGGGGTDRAGLADLDRGYWRNYADNRYAGYESAEKPVACIPPQQGNAPARLEVRVPSDSVPRRADTGWDISHARRLVPALDALERNRSAIATQYGLGPAELPPAGLAAAFAATLVGRVWNGDAAQPLFANYWSGANGWYRVAYDNGTGKCREGYPPYGMSDAFLTGGYIAWARYQPVIALLGRRLYALVETEVGAEPAGAKRRSGFIDRHYPALSGQAGTRARALATFMVLPSLVGTGAGK